MASATAHARHAVGAPPLLAKRPVETIFPECPLDLHCNPPFRATMDVGTPHPAHPFFQELTTFVLAVILGSLSGLATSLLLAHWVSPPVASNVALAVATTCTGAAHAHFVHRQPWMTLLPKIGAGAPLAYGAMRLVHAVLGS